MKMYWLKVESSGYNVLYFVFESLTEAATFMEACLKYAAGGAETITLSVLKGDKEKNPFKL